MTKGRGAFPVSRFKPTTGILVGSGSKSSGSTTASEKEEVPGPSSDHLRQAQMMGTLNSPVNDKIADIRREFLKRFSPVPAQSNSQMERGNQRLLNVERQSPPLCNVISPVGLHLFSLLTMMA